MEARARFLPGAFRLSRSLVNRKHLANDIGVSAVLPSTYEPVLMGQNQHPSEDAPRRFVSPQKGEHVPTRVFSRRPVRATIFAFERGRPTPATPSFDR
jgi:hypothetical protein